MEDINVTASALLPAALVGTVLNWAVFYSIHKLKSFNHSFGFLLTNQTLFDALNSTSFLFYFCPMVLFDVPIMKQYSHHCGFVILLCSEISIMTHLAISFNRFCAVWIPYSYQSIFSNKNTKFLIAAILLFCVSVALLFYEKLCYLYYDEKIHFLTFSTSDLCSFIGWYGDFLKNASIVAFVVFMDILTVVKVRMITKKVESSINENAQNKMSSREMRFLKQTVAQGSVFMMELLAYFFVPQYTTNKMIAFFSTSFAWVAMHAADGMVVLIFNPEVRRFLFCQGSSHKVTSTSQITVNLNHQ